MRKSNSLHCIIWNLRLLNLYSFLHSLLSPFTLLQFCPFASYKSYFAVAVVLRSVNSPRSNFNFATIAIMAALSVVYSNFGM